MKQISSGIQMTGGGAIKIEGLDQFRHCLAG
jgi:hypothetical protein